MFFLTLIGFYHHNHKTDEDPNTKFIRHHKPALHNGSPRGGGGDGVVYHRYQKTSPREYFTPTRERHTQPISPNETLAAKPRGHKSVDIYCPLCKIKFSKVPHFQQHFQNSHPNVPNFICKGCHIVFLSTEEFDRHECSLSVLQNFQFIPKMINGVVEEDENDRMPKSTIKNHHHHLKSPHHHHNNGGVGVGVGDGPASAPSAFENRCNLCGQHFNNRFHLNEHLEDHGDGSPPFCQICGKFFDRMDLLNAHIIQHRGSSISESVKHSKSEVRTESFSRKHSPIGVNNSVAVKDTYCNENSRSHHYTNGSHHTSPRNTEQSSSRSSSTSYDSNEHQPYEPVRMAIPHLPPPSPTQYKENKKISNFSYPYDQTKYSPNAVTNQQRRSSDSDSALMYYHQQQKEQRLSSTTREQNNHHLLKVEPYHQIRQTSPVKPNAIKAAPQTVVNGGNQNPAHRNEQLIAPTPGSVLLCNKCGETFTSPSLYDIHLQSHNEIFECNKCNKTLTTRSQYDFHMQSHETGNTSKSHKCPYCHRSFSMKGNLRRHIRIHTNEAPYECPICFQRFRRSDGLKGHIKRHETLGESAPNDLLPSQV